MTDDVTNTNTAPAPAQISAAPVDAAPTNISPSVAPTGTPLHSNSPASPDAGSFSTDPVPAEKTAATTILGKEQEAPVTAAEPVKPVTPETTIPEPKADGNQSDEPAPLPAYESFILPEGSSFEAEKLSNFSKLLGEFENSKSDHDGYQKFGQSLVDLHIAEVKDAVTRVTDAYAKQWEKQTKDWYDAFTNDPEIGGNRVQTTSKDALEFVRNYAGNEAQLGEFRQLMETTGLGNHPALIRIFANAQRARSEGTPLPATRPAMQNRSKVATRYGQK